MVHWGEEGTSPSMKVWLGHADSSEGHDSCLGEGPARPARIRISRCRTESSLGNPTTNPELRPGLSWPVPQRLIRGHCVSCSEGSFYVVFYFFLANFIFYRSPPAQGSKAAMTGAFAGGAFYGDVTY